MNQPQTYDAFVSDFAASLKAAIRVYRDDCILLRPILDAIIKFAPSERTRKEYEGKKAADIYEYISNDPIANSYNSTHLNTSKIVRCLPSFSNPNTDGGPRIAFYRIDCLNGYKMSDKELKMLNVNSHFRHMPGYLRTPTTNCFFISGLFNSAHLDRVDYDASVKLHKSLYAASLGIVNAYYAKIDVQHRVIFAMHISVAIARILEIPTSSHIIAMAYSCNDIVGQHIINKYDLENKKFKGLPWTVD